MSCLLIEAAPANKGNNYMRCIKLVRGVEWNCSGQPFGGNVNGEDVTSDVFFASICKIAPVKNFNLPTIVYFYFFLLSMTGVEAPYFEKQLY